MFGEVVRPDRFPNGDIREVRSDWVVLSSSTGASVFDAACGTSERSIMMLVSIMLMTMSGAVGDGRCR
jgi:hypothetical protein